MSKTQPLYAMTTSWKTFPKNQLEFSQIHFNNWLSFHGLGLYFKNIIFEILRNNEVVRNRMRGPFPAPPPISFRDLVKIFYQKDLNTNQESSIFIYFHDDSSELR